MKEVSIESAALPLSCPSGTSVGPMQHMSFHTVASGLMELSRFDRRSMWVAKRSMTDHTDTVVHKQACEKDVIHQTLAKHYAERFNLEVRRASAETGLGRCGAH